MPSSCQGLYALAESCPWVAHGLTEPTHTPSVAHELFMNIKSDGQAYLPGPLGVNTLHRTELEPTHQNRSHQSTTQVPKVLMK